jgi:hypothetical protein
MISSSTPLFLLLLICVTAGLTVDNVEINGASKFTLKKGETKKFCYDHPEDLHIFRFFDKILINIKAVNVDLPWYCIKGISTDDLHTHFQTIVYAIFGGDKRSNLIATIDPLNKGSFLRDAASSCPNPIYGTDRSECSMSFSTLGTSCATIAVDQKVDILVEVTRDFNKQSVFLLAAGLIVLLLASQFSRSKIFQYSTGAISFLVGALVLSFLYVAFNLGRKEKKGSNFMRDSAILLFFGGGYGAGLVYLLRENFNTLLLQYWEVTMAYLVVSSCLGLYVTRLIRGNDVSKHSLTTAVKWFLRLIGTMLIYNAFPSPLVSILAVTVLAILYFFHMVGKWITGLLTKKKAKKNA